MNDYFPVFNSVRQDSDQIIAALNERAGEIQKKAEQSVTRKIIRVSLKIIAIIGLAISLAALSYATVSFTATPFIISGTGFCLGLSTLPIFILINERNSVERMIKKCWKTLFESLMHGNGDEILKSAEALMNQKKQYPQQFDRSTCKLRHTQNLSPFFHKVCAVAFLLKAIGNVAQGKENQMQADAQSAFFHFETSELPKSFGDVALSLMENQMGIKRLIIEKKIGDRDIRSIDYLIYMMRNQEKAAA